MDNRITICGRISETYDHVDLGFGEPPFRDTEVAAQRIATHARQGELAPLQASGLGLAETILMEPKGEIFLTDSAQDPRGLDAPFDLVSSHCAED